MLKGPYTVGCCDIEKDMRHIARDPTVDRPVYGKTNYSPYLLTGGTSSTLPTNVSYYGGYAGAPVTAHAHAQPVYHP